MKELEVNIWGNTGCELPNGKLCTACCVLSNIELEGVYVSLAKPAHSPCPNLEEGCKLHLVGVKPDSCKSWHCSMADLNGKLDLIAQGLSLEQVSEEEAVLAGGAFVLFRAKYLSKMTYNRALIERDLDEP